MNIEDKEMQELYNSLTPEQQKASKELEKALTFSLAKTDWAVMYEEKTRSEIEAAERNEWIVDTKIGSNGCSVEVSAVVKGTHGEKSWGWPGENKYVVLSTSKTFGQATPVLPSIIALAEEEARRICHIKN